LLDEQERKRLLVNRDKLAESSLRGHYVQRLFILLILVILFGVGR
jgi:hypothetical protein